MFLNLGWKMVDCDAPPYPVVQASRLNGIHAPEDVRWCRLSRFLHWPMNGWDLVRPSWWRHFITAWKGSGEAACSCGQKLPVLEPWMYADPVAEETSFLIGQCSRCHTVFWEEAQPAHSRTR